MRDHIQRLEDWPVPGINRWINAYHMLYVRYLELDNPAIEIPKEPIFMFSASDPNGAARQEQRWRDHVQWAVSNGIADDILRMLKESPSVVKPGAQETFDLRPWENKG